LLLSEVSITILIINVECKLWGNQLNSSLLTGVTDYKPAPAADPTMSFRRAFRITQLKS